MSTHRRHAQAMTYLRPRQEKLTVLLQRMEQGTCRVPFTVHELGETPQQLDELVKATREQLFTGVGNPRPEWRKLVTDHPAGKDVYQLITRWYQLLCASKAYGCDLDDWHRIDSAARFDDQLAATAAQSGLASVTVDPSCFLCDCTENSEFTLCLATGAQGKPVREWLALYRCIHCERLATAARVAL